MHTTLDHLLFLSLISLTLIVLLFISLTSVFLLRHFRYRAQIAQSKEHTVKATQTHPTLLTIPKLVGLTAENPQHTDSDYVVILIEPEQSTQMPQARATV